MTAAPKTMSDSGIFFHRQSKASVTRASKTVGMSVIVRRPGDRADGGSRDPLDEGRDGRAFAVLAEGRSGDHHEGIAGQEHPQGRHKGPTKAGHQEADEAGDNHHRSGRNHGDGHRVHELAVGEPVVPLHHASV
jgi:hypothetical protein